MTGPRPLPTKPVAVFVDYDGTITNRDTFDVLVPHLVGSGLWHEIDDALLRGEISVRDALSREAALVTCTLDEADDFLRAIVGFDPTFRDFVARVRASGASLEVVSSGLAPLIRRALERNGLGDLDLIANDLDPSPTGWKIHFRDDSPNGTDKVARVQAARARGATTVYIGDGVSDFHAALEADVRIAKRGRELDKHLRARGVPYETFESFAEVDPRTFREEAGETAK